MAQTFPVGALQGERFPMPCHCRRGFAHGDLKPANILLSDAQHLQVKLADFGHSKVVNDVLTPDIVGTPLYMAPELFARQAFDARAADLWSLGVILYELLTMHCPFAGTGAELTEAIQKCEISFWADDDIPVPSSSAQSLVKALLRRQPSRRPTLEWCLIHSFVSGPGTVGRLLLRDGLRATEVSEAEDAMLQERYLLPQLTEMHIRELRNDLRKWMLKFRCAAMIVGHEVVANYGLASLGSCARERIDNARVELLHVMAFHTGARRPASSNVDAGMGTMATATPTSHADHAGAQGSLDGARFKAQTCQQCPDAAPISAAASLKVIDGEEDEAAARQRRLKARQKASRTWNFSGRSGVKPTVDADFRMQEVELQRARRQAFSQRAFQTKPEDREL